MNDNPPRHTLRPPANVEAEQSVIGALMLNPSVIDQFDWLEPRHFYRGDHRLIFECCRKLIEAGKHPDILVVDAALKAEGKDANDYGGLAYLGTVCQSTPSWHNAMRYAEIVRELAVRRELMAKAQEVFDAAMHPNMDVLELAEKTEESFLSILQPDSNDETVSLLAAVDMAMESERQNVRGMPTGYAGIDGIIDGLRDEELIVVAGRPGMGKSALVQGIAEHIAANGSVYVWTGEMAAKQLGRRSLAWHRHNLGEADAVNHIAGLRLEIDTRSPMSIGMLRLRLRRHKRKHGLRLVVADYLQLMAGVGKNENRNQEVGSISRGLKSIAKEFKCPVIVVSSLNRALESRTDKRPVMSDLRESGDIESDADIIIMVYRDSMYNGASSLGNVAQIIVRKHREGAIGEVNMEWRPEQQRFVNYYGNDPMDEPARGDKVMTAPIRAPRGKARKATGKDAAAGQDE